jgi:putative membrane protein
MLQRVVVVFALALSTTALAADPTVATPPVALTGVEPSPAPPGPSGVPIQPGDVPTAKMPEALNDGQIVTVLLTANQGEVDIGKVIVARSKNPQVTKFAQLMIDDHSAMRDKLQEWMKKSGTRATPSKTADNLDHDARNGITEYTVLRSPELDRKYMDAAVEDHQNDLDLLDQLATEAVDADLAGLIRESRPKVEGHLADARRIQADLAANAPKSSKGKGSPAQPPTNNLVSPELR